MKEMGLSVRACVDSSEILLLSVALRFGIGATVLRQFVVNEN